VFEYQRCGWATKFGQKNYEKGLNVSPVIASAPTVFSVKQFLAVSSNKVCLKGMKISGY
jgi:hypothetical protein